MRKDELRATLQYMRSCGAKKFLRLQIYLKEQGTEHLIAFAVEIRNGKLPSEYVPHSEEETFANKAIYSAYKFRKSLRPPPRVINVPGGVLSKSTNRPGDPKRPRFDYVSIADDLRPLTRRR